MPVAEVWVVIDEGCQECGVSTEPIGIFWTEAEAQVAAEACPTYEARWRDGGQAYVCVYKMDLPALIDGDRDA